MYEKKKTMYIFCNIFGYMPSRARYTLETFENRLKSIGLSQNSVRLSKKNQKNPWECFRNSW